MSHDLIRETLEGLYCEAGDFHVDPWLPVSNAVITHAHADHARPGSSEYLCSQDGLAILQKRLGDEAVIHTLPYGEQLSRHGVKVSLHPAGHVLGSAQVRIEYRGQICVVSGDYKTDTDPTCRPFEVVPCHTFITESTFGLPIYRWPSQSDLWQVMNDWWRKNADAGHATVVFAYALGKAQRVLAGLDHSIGPVFCHGAVDAMNEAYRKSGINLPPATYVGSTTAEQDWSRALILAPPSAMGSVWLRRFGEPATAFVSGWMLIRGARRRRSVDRGFPLSDHADWPGLLATIQATGAEQVFVTHGQVAPMVRWLTEKGLAAFPLRTEFEGEQDEGAEQATTPEIIDGVGSE
jgi:putative mRNA 3-end processing factor